jgi:rhodanese-related sulfurtransferase
MDTRLTRYVSRCARSVISGASIFCFVLAGCIPETRQAHIQYITWDGLEPDKWASVWLVKRHIAPNAAVLIRPLGSPVDEGIPFGVPEANFRRTHGVSIYQSLLRGYQLQDPALRQLSDIIQDIEITPWSIHKNEHSAVIEHAFRALQEHFEQREVPIACYGHFFDLVYEELQRKESRPDWAALSNLTDGGACKPSARLIATRDKTPFVRQIDTTKVLDMIGAGKNVIFVDAREPAEFNRYHIPGAHNLQIRHVNPDTKVRFEGADLVIGYCIKDFRGFELARALADVGVENTAIMKPYGIAGWRGLGLPTTDVSGLSEPDALEQLRRCAQGISQCIRS